MSRRKRYIKGRVYFTNDQILVGGAGKRRRVVAMNNDKEHMEVRRIMTFSDKNSKKNARLIRIEKYPDIRKPSGVEKKTFRKTVNKKPIEEKFMQKTRTRLNKWDMARIRRGK